MIAGTKRCFGDSAAMLWRRNRRFLAGSLFVAAAISIATAVGRIEATDLVRLIAFFASFAGGLIGMSGIVSADKRAHRLDVWLAKSATPVPFYLGVAWCRLLAIAVAVGALSAAIAFPMLISGDFTFEIAARLMIGMIGVSWLAASTVFALSALGIERDALAAAIVLIVTVQVIALGLAGAHGWAAHATILAFPVDALSVITRGAGDHLRATGVLLSHFAIWMIVGVVALTRPAHKLVG